MKKITILFATILLSIASTITVSANLSFSNDVFANVEVSGVDDVNITGDWKMEADANGQSVPITLKLTQTKETFSGTLSTPFGDGTIENGKITGVNLTALVKLDFQGQPLELNMSGKIDKDKMTGTMEGEAVPLVTFTAEKTKKEKTK
jgi:hypothetical protein